MVSRCNRADWEVASNVKTCWRTICEDSFMLCIDGSWRKLQPALSPLSMNRQHKSYISLSNESTVWWIVKYPCFHKQYVMYAMYVIYQKKKKINTICCINKSALTNCGFSMLLWGHSDSTYMSQNQYSTVFGIQICKWVQPLFSMSTQCLSQMYK